MRSLTTAIEPCRTADRSLDSITKFGQHAVMRRSGRADRLFKLVASLGVIGVAVALAAAVLWNRQSSDALLRVRTMSSGVEQVAFWATPTLVSYLLLSRTWLFVVVGGLVLNAMLVWTWWVSAVERSSTASLGPGFMGWIFGPVALVATSVLCTWLRPRSLQTLGPDENR